MTKVKCSNSTFFQIVPPSFLFYYFCVSSSEIVWLLFLHLYSIKYLKRQNEYIVDSWLFNVTYDLVFLAQPFIVIYSKEKGFYGQRVHRSGILLRFCVRGPCLHFCHIFTELDSVEYLFNRTSTSLPLCANFLLLFRLFSQLHYLILLFTQSFLSFKSLVYVMETKYKN